MSPRPRRKSVDSSSSSSDSDSSHKDQKNKNMDRHESETHNYGSNYAPIRMPEATTSFPSANHSPDGGDHDQHNSAGPASFQSKGPEFHSPPPYAPVQPPPPPSGYRVPLTTTGAFPDPQQTGQPPLYDADGTSAIFIGSALLERSVHPCKIGHHLRPFVSVPYGGGEHGHQGRYDLLPFRPDQMEFVRTSHGMIPPGRRPIEGGYEEDGAKLYHAIGVVNGVKVPGKCGEHLRGCRVAFGGVEHSIDNNYEILCWR